MVWRFAGTAVWRFEKRTPFLHSFILCPEKQPVHFSETLARRPAGHQTGFCFVKRRGRGTPACSSARRAFDRVSVTFAFAVQNTLRRAAPCLEELPALNGSLL
eukprot:37734-Chlamydomonas_euryale.AAC.1